MDAVDPSDSLPIDSKGVGPWAREKHDRLSCYVRMSREARRKYVDRAGATYIDLFCSYGRARARDNNEIIDGSPLVAFKAAADDGVPFTELHVGDFNAEAADATQSRLEALGAPVRRYTGPAAETVDEVASALDPYGLHFAFLDPYNLESLPFSVLKSLARFRRMDMLVHVSALEIQRNVETYYGKPDQPLDYFAPGWRDAIDLNAAKRQLPQQVFDYWLSRLETLQTQASDRVVMVRGPSNQRLYWLVLVARHKLAHKFWNVCERASAQRALDL